MLPPNKPAVSAVWTGCALSAASMSEDQWFYFSVSTYLHGRITRNVEPFPVLVSNSRLAFSSSHKRLLPDLPHSGVSPHGGLVLRRIG